MGEDRAELGPLLPCCPLEVAVTWVTWAQAVTSLQWVWVPPGMFLCLSFPWLPPDKHLNSKFPGKELGQTGGGGGPRWPRAGYSHLFTYLVDTVLLSPLRGKERCRL